MPAVVIFRDMLTKWRVQLVYSLHVIWEMVGVV